MSFLVGLAAALIEWLFEKLAALGFAKYKEIEQNQAIEDQTKKDIDAVKGATTDEERDDAAKSIAGHIG